MSNDDGRVIVKDGLCTQCAISTKQIHHRHFPEIRAECGTVADGARHLASRLSLYREGAQSVLHRELLDRAIADVRAFLDEAAGDEQGPGDACRCAARVTGTAVPPPPELGASEGRERPGVPTPSRDVEAAGGVASPC